MNAEQQSAKAKAKLDKLGKMNPDEIAAFLKRKKIHGSVGRANSCPIANYLRARGTSPHSWAGHTYLYNGEEAIRHPPSVAFFIDRFDEGHYPDLES